MVPCMLCALCVPLYVAIKGDSLPNLDCLLATPLTQTLVNEPGPVRLAPVPAWRKVKRDLVIVRLTTMLLI